MRKRLLIFLAAILSFCISVPAFSQANSKKRMPSLKHVYRQTPAKNTLFIVISKKHQRLYVCSKQGGDTVIVCTYSVCLSKNLGNKQRRGDMKTPESPKGRPFTITQIQDASTWRHNFGDGNGNILAYGHWFLRLLTPGHSGIGIHGSTNNEEKVPGRWSEGCIRLRDVDIEHLKENYAYKGMPVIIQAENEDSLPFKVRPEKKNAAAEIEDSIANDSLKADTAEVYEEVDITEADEGAEKVIQVFENEKEVAVKMDGVYLLVQPMPSSAIMKDQEGNEIVLKKGDILKTTGETENYYRINYNGREGYVPKNLVEIK